MRGICMRSCVYVCPFLLSLCLASFYFPLHILNEGLRKQITYSMEDASLTYDMAEKAAVESPGKGQDMAVVRLLIKDIRNGSEYASATVRHYQSKRFY